jgi:hypothetical protein
MDLQPRGARQGDTRDDTLPFRLGLGGVAVDHGVAPAAGVDLDHGRSQLGRHLDLAGVGGDEQRHPDAGVVEPGDERRQRIVLADHVQSALGGEFLAPLRHQAHGVGFCGERDPQHILGRRHLEIQRLRYLGLEAAHVGVADVAAVLAQMRGDAVGACFNRGERSAHRIRPRTAPRVAQGGDVVDIDAETERRNGHNGLTD